MNTIYTYGYQGSTAEQLQAYQEEHNALVVDIRYAPRSRDPRWNKLALLKVFGFSYRWMQALGNINYRGGPIQLAQPEHALEEMRIILRNRSVILVCACWNVDTCHRKVAAEYLAQALNAPVEHLSARVQSSQSENLLRCLSLTQPWASLVMLGKKRIETRSWSSRFRGLLGIHAAKGVPKSAKSLCFLEPFHSALIAADYDIWNPPVGALLGTVQLVDVVPTAHIRLSIDDDEYAFGDYTPGRWAWIFEDPKPLPAPIPMRGALQLWTTEYRLSEQEVVHAE